MSKSGKRKQEPRALTSATAERLAAIVEAAEQAASKVLDDAEEQARQRLAEAVAVADRLVAKRLRAIADELDPPETGDQRPRLRPVESDSPAPSPAGARSAAAGARLLATQMAVSGSSREEIAERLGNGFDLDDASEILDAILGPEE